MHATGRFALLVAILAALALVSGNAKGGPPQAPRSSEVILSKGLRGRIGDGKLRRARLVFADRSLTAELESETPEEFEYSALKTLRGRHHIGLPLFDKRFWLDYLLYGAAPAVASGGILSGIVVLLWGIGGGHAWFFLDRLRNGHHPHWLSLHSRSEHRCVFLALPNKRKLRQAIFAELERRDPTELRTRPPPSPGYRDLPPIPLLGEPAPDFELASLRGARWRLSEAAGSVVLLNFWETWCGPCRLELPHLQNIHERFGAAGLVVVGVSSDDAAGTSQYLQDHGITYEALSDNRHRASHLYRVGAIPTTFIIGRDGTLEERIEGYTKQGAFARAVRRHLGKPAARPAP